MGDSNVTTQLVHSFRERGITMATCESLTAGLLAATIANTPGASQVLRGGLITYATDTKALLAGVPVDLLEHYGPVDPRTARAMAQGARQQLQADLALSCTGVAGPSSQDGHPCGEVFIACATVHKEWVFQLGYVRQDLGALLLIDDHPQDFRLRGDRGQIREATVELALALALYCSDDRVTPGFHSYQELMCTQETGDKLAKP